MTEQINQFGGTPLCVGVFTPTRPGRSEQCVKKGGGREKSGEGRDDSVHRDESGKQGGRVSEAEAHLGGAMSACLIRVM